MKAELAAIQADAAEKQSQLETSQKMMNHMNHKLHEKYGPFRTDGDLLLDVGGKLFSVPRRLLCSDPASALASLCSTAVDKAVAPQPPQPQPHDGSTATDAASAPSSGAAAVPSSAPQPQTQPLFIERDGELFEQVLSFLDDGSLPPSAQQLRALYLESAVYRLTALRDAIEARLVAMGQSTAQADMDELDSRSDPAAVLARALLEAAPSAAHGLRSRVELPPLAFPAADSRLGASALAQGPVSPERAALVKAAAAIARAEAVNSWSLPSQAAALGASGSSFLPSASSASASSSYPYGPSSSLSPKRLQPLPQHQQLSPSARLRNQLELIERDIPEAVAAQRAAEVEAQAAAQQRAALAAIANGQVKSISTADYVTGSWRSLYAPQPSLQPLSQAPPLGQSSLYASQTLAPTLQLAPLSPLRASTSLSSPYAGSASLHELAAATALPDPFGFTSRRSNPAALAPLAPLPSQQQQQQFPQPQLQQSNYGQTSAVMEQAPSTAASFATLSPPRSPSRFSIPKSAAASVLAGVGRSAVSSAVIPAAPVSVAETSSAAALTTADLSTADAAPSTSAAQASSGPGDNVSLELMLSSLASLRRQAAESTSRLSILSSWSPPAAAASGSSVDVTDAAAVSVVQPVETIAAEPSPTPAPTLEPATAPAAAAAAVAAAEPLSSVAQTSTDAASVPEPAVASATVQAASDASSS